MASRKGTGVSEVKMEINGVGFNVKEIKPDKLYVLQTEYMLKPEQAKAILDVWQQVTGAKAMLLDRVKIEEAIQRVRELLKKWDEDGMACGCFDVAIADLTTALDGEQR